MTTIDSRRASRLCSDLKGATLDHTFGEDVDVHRVANKMFALVNVAGGEIITLKATPEDVAALVAELSFVTPGYYMNKKHWITIDLSVGIDATELEELVHESYRLVFSSLPKRLQLEIETGASSASEKPAR